ncbi:uncharacterized protein LOC120008483 [Tripterygium wilfordii]|uniref:uncharacterized protein LOC120008483 n=1 Tax=Tripterygium wilfordii TaxID=458696 RepID=UPI0018F7FB7E|nr:uncharacterized protein LOC120008483 [Tripterygium wilfordii]XP_038714752.1 uncharacterized protein LOC120008483 [Tripterygium wilfordii]
MSTSLQGGDADFEARRRCRSCSRESGSMSTSKQGVDVEVEVDVDFEARSRCRSGGRSRSRRWPRQSMSKEVLNLKVKAGNDFPCCETSLKTSQTVSNMYQIHILHYDRRIHAF